MDELTGRTAVVTGAASGIGRSLATRFAREGMSVVLADVEADALASAAGVVAELADRDAGGRVVAVQTDVADAASVEALAVRAFDELGAVHVLCNNAGVFQGGVTWERSTADYEWTLGVNLWGILHGIRSFVPRMLEQGDDAHVVNTISTAGLATTPFCAPYEVSKFAAAAATECLAHDLRARNAPIGVSMLCPGSVDTAIARSRRNRPEHLVEPRTDRDAVVEEALARTTGAGAHPDHVAECVVRAIHEDIFFVPTSEGGARLLLDRAAALADGRLPGPAAFD
ncbi:MAG TPA: SDR family NAD(P)-dependent oxidoreductase [Acidimicrobiia bacterium]